jgi:hypothetical protein
LVENNKERCLLIAGVETVSSTLIASGMERMQERMAYLSTQLAHLEIRFPLRVRIQKSEDLKYDTDLFIDQIRSISNSRFMFRYCKVQPNVLKKVEEALKNLTGR